MRLEDAPCLGALTVRLARGKILIVTSEGHIMTPKMLPIRPSEALNAHREDIRKIVAAHRGANPRVFGSTVRGEDKVGSDLDILIDGQSGMTLFDICAIWHEVETLLGVPADVVTACSLRPRIRERVFAEAQPI